MTRLVFRIPQDLRASVFSSGLFLASGLFVQFVAGYWLEPAEFADFSILLYSALLINVVLSGGLSLGVSREIAANPGAIRATVGRFLVAATLATCATAILVLLFASRIEAFLRIRTIPGGVAILAGLVGIYAFSAVFVGALNGNLQGARGAALLAGAHLLKIVGAPLALFLGWGGAGLLISYGLSNAVPVVGGVIWRTGLRKDSTAARPLPIRFMAGASLFSCSIFAFLAGDLYAAKLLLPPASAGVYIAASTLGRLPVLVTQSLAAVAFPRLRTWTSTARTYLVALAFTAGTLSVITAVAGPFAVSFIYGTSYKPSARLLVELQLPFFMSCLAIVANHLQVARDQTRMVLLSIGAGALAFGLGIAAAWGTISPNGLVVTLTAASGVWLVLSLVSLAFKPGYEGGVNDEPQRRGQASRT